MLAKNEYALSSLFLIDGVHGLRPNQAGQTVAALYAAEAFSYPKHTLRK
jgi:hypothetical protein